MTDSERLDFEARLKNDPELKSEFNFQKEIVDAIKDTRRAELKAMLDKVPVGGSSGGSTSLGKVMSTLVIAGLIGAGIYYLWPVEEEQIEPTENITMVEPAEEPAEEATETEVTEEETPIIEKEGGATKTVEKPRPDIKSTKDEKDEVAEITPARPEINKPNVAPTFETAEDADSLEAPGSNLASTGYGDHAALDVEIDNTNRNFSFHYQFKSGKLFLYGSFDKGLYEILEINSRGEKTLFLYYKDKFYPLNRNQVKIVPLDPVKEPTLMEKLRKARVDG
ncbi:hypothetical protein C900_01195 [Fulvivirga imtechensis AK7]|uniref:Uncharacterized protein n=2 Tax=Fulvivirga TaxID=396811 RepID=L8JKM1_9BACT|nr:hypothetical protein C900_01195 [Fulvivirga imtechensis AK7]